MGRNSGRANLAAKGKSAGSKGGAATGGNIGKGGSKGREAPPKILKPNTTAPDFTLHSTPDQTLSLHELRGRKVVLAFYPGDWSPMCGDEMSLLNETMPLFRKHNAQVVGISVDSKWSHHAFSKDRNLHFPLLADFEPKGGVSRRYGSYNDSEGTCDRCIYIIDEQGMIRWSYKSPTGMNPGVDGVLTALEGMDHA